MHRLVSPFILEKYAAGESSGRFDAATLFVDMSGFSAMTSALMQHGQHGAEVLATVMRAIFDPLVEAVYAHGGFITVFAGDAFTAVILDDGRGGVTPPLRALAVARTIRERMRACPSHDTPYGVFEVAAKIGLAAGEVRWRILRGADDARATFYFRGDGIDGCAQAQKFAGSGDLVLHPSALRVLAHTVAAEPLAGGYAQVSGVTSELPSARPVALPPPDSEALARFFPPRVIEQSQSGEFRQAINVFISLRGDPTALQLTQFMQTVFDLQRKFGGLLNRLDFGDKGCSLLLFWGAPVSHENDVVRALSFLLELHDLTDLSLRAGVTSRIAHAGFIGSYLHEEYTCYGDGVNLAARLMTSAPWESIWVDQQIKVRAEHQFELDGEGQLEFKGFVEAQEVYSLLGYRKAEVLDVYDREMVGREGEMARLADFVQPILGPPEQRCCAGVLVVQGEAGIGKSRLVHDFQHRTAGSLPRGVEADRDAPAVSGPQWFLCQTDQILQSSLNPFRYWLRDYFGQSTAQSEAHNKRVFSRKMAQLINSTPDQALRQELERSQSLLAALVDLHWSDSLYARLTPQLRYENSLGALKTLLLAESLRQPVVLVIEDVHWLDEDSVVFVERLVRDIEKYPVAILATARPDGDRRYFGPDVDYHVLELAGLSAGDIATLSADILDAPPGPGLLELLADRAAGNPFFAEQILLYLRDAGLVERTADGTWRLVESVPATSLLPSGIRAIFIARLDRLAHEVKEVVQAAAVLGREFDVRVLASVLRQEAVHLRIQEAELAAIWTALTEIRYLFKHILLREAAYDMQVQSRRADLHELAAQALEQVFQADLTPRLGEIAYHYEMASRLGLAHYAEPARSYLTRAGLSAKERHENASAVDYFSRALALTPEDALAERFDLIYHRQWIWGRQGKRDLQREAMRELASLVDRLDDDVRRVDVAINEAKYAEEVSDAAAAMDAAQRAVTLARAANLPLKEAQGYYEWGLALYRLGEYGECRERLGTCLALAREQGDRKLQAEAMHVMGFSLEVLGDYARAKAMHDDVLRIFQEIGDRAGEMAVLNSLGIVYHELGQPERSWATFEQALALARELGQALAQARYLGNLGELAYKTDRLAEAQTFCQQALSLARQIRHREGEGIASNNLGVAALRLGNFDTARAYLEGAIAIGRELQNPLIVAEASGYLGMLHSWAGDHDAGQEVSQQALDLARQVGARHQEGLALSSLAACLTGQGRLQEASAAYQEALAQRQGLGQEVLAIEARAGLARTALAEDDLAAAQAEADVIMAYLEPALAAPGPEHGLASGEEPLAVYLTCCRVLDAAGDPRASLVLNRAYAILQAQALALPDAEQRQSFLRNVPYHREILLATRAELEALLGREAAPAVAILPVAPAAVVDLSNAILTGAKLIGAALSRVALSGANLSKADLRGANLTGSDLTGAFLVDADLRGAELANAKLCGADLTGADLRGADLTDATWDEQTRWPVGFAP